MQRQLVTDFTRKKLLEYGLTDWSVRLSIDEKSSFLGLCSHVDKAIIINAFHCDVHPDAEVIDTILHEIAHALVGPGNGHNDVWASKAREIGCKNTEPCSHLDLPPHVIDAIRSGANVEVIVEEKVVEQVVRNVTHRVTRLQDKCPTCGKVAVERFSCDTVDKEGNDVKLITLDCFHIIKKVKPKGTPFHTMVSNFWKPEVASCIHKWDRNGCSICGEFKLFNFQIEGAKATEIALASGKGILIADEMGLGKTVQALAYLKFHGKNHKTMVVTKSAIKFQWFKQAVRWLGPEYIAQIITTSRDYLMPNLRLYIIPYDLLRRFKREKLHALGINLVILDECQQIKNPDSSRTQEVRRLVSATNNCKVIELSGTPWKNRGSEFFPALNLIDPIKFHSYQHYLDTWVEFYWDGAKRKMGGIRSIERFKKYTEGLIVRREYDEVMDEFPSVTRNKLPVQLDALNQTAYDDSESEFVAWWNNKVIGGEEDKVSSMEIIAQLQRMRHICGLAKIPATLEYLTEFVEEADDKIIVFVHHRDVGQLITKALKDTNKETNPDWYETAQACIESGVKILQYTSDHTGKEIGTEIQDTFNNSKRAILIASTLACGEGIDLQTCNKAILHERQWNPQNEDQAAPGRMKRIGQLAKNITIINPEGEGTTDEYLDNMVDRKRRYFHAVHNKSEIVTWNQDEAMRELANMIVAKHAQKNKGVKVAGHATLVKR